MLLNANYNPDVLTCLANLSNDEVFTPPSVVNQMLDMLPEEIWEDETATFLDPASKSGVFLREITKRLITGLESKIPNLEKRIAHILSKQVFGIAITELTALLSRRSVYCSKQANGKYSIFANAPSPEGNIKFGQIEHSWKGKKCVYCGASEATFNREESFESHAYEFIHTDEPQGIFDMKFDVIIGNPPYQLNDGGAQASATPIYQKFVQQAIKLNPRYLTMIIPARWYAGGKGLDEFRDTMLNDCRIEKLIDFFDSTLCFPGVDISGGVCYFLWNRDYHGKCSVKTITKNSQNELQRPLLEKGGKTFIRFNEAISILEKVFSHKETNLSEKISSRKPFGIATNVKVSEKKEDGFLRIYAYPKNGFASEKEITNNYDAVDKYKVLIAYAYGERGGFPYRVISVPFIGEPKSICSETYLILDSFDDEEMAKNMISYLKTKFARFLILQKKNTQHATAKVYGLVPQQDFSKSWSDDDLFKKYQISDTEKLFINEMVREME